MRERRQCRRASLHPALAVRLHGLHWTQVAAAAPWSPRDYPGLLVFKDALYLLGGEGDYDLWRSVDGQSWTQLASQAPWGNGRRGASREAFDGRLWIFSGKHTGGGDNWGGDVWILHPGSAGW